MDLKARTYCDIINALVLWRRACSDAAMATEIDNLTEENKVAVSNAVNEIIRLQRSVGFLLPTDTLDALESSINTSFGKTWQEMSDIAHEALIGIFGYARRDVGIEK